MSNMFYGAVKPIFQRAEELRKNPTHTELLLWQYLKANQLGVRFKRQHPIWMYIADFYCHRLRLVIEVDGSIHKAEDVKESDKIREEDIISFGIKVVRFNNDEIKNDVESVVEKIKAIVNELKKSNDEKEI